MFILKRILSNLEMDPSKLSPYDHPFPDCICNTAREEKELS